VILFKILFLLCLRSLSIKIIFKNNIKKRKHCKEIDITHMENLYESYNFEQDIENFAIMDDKQDNEGINNTESRNEHEKYPFSSY
jgi:hypothetical protein